MKPNNYMLALAVVLLACGSRVLAEDSAGGKAVTVSLTDSLYLSDFDDQADEAAPQAPAVVDSGSADTTPIWMNNPALVCEPVPADDWLAVRFGWWAVGTAGSKAMVGEWQGLESSTPFYDVDGLTSDGWRTANFYISGPESEATMAGLEFYNGPGLSFEIDYRRFLHRFGIKPIGGPAMADGYAPAGGFFDPPLPNGDPGYVLWGSGDTVGRDLVNAGDDYAIRVQQFQADVGGRINETFSWRVNFWGMKKEGTRQANTQQHCFRDTPAPGGSSCHVTTQGQHIDWLTMEVEPVIAANFEWFSLEYSRTMRSFQQDDQMVMADFTSGSSTRYGLGGTGAYAYVPESYTEIDRLKLRSQLSCNTDLYVLGFLGNTHNKFRASDRKFYGVDGRVTNQSIEGLNLVGYAKTHVQNNSADTQALNDRYPGDAQWLEAVPPQEFHEFFTGENQYLGLVDRHWSSIGFKSRWRPFYDSCGLANGFAMVGGYEWSEIKRTSVDYELDNLGEFTQPTTVSNKFFIGVQENWSPGLTSFVRYRLIANSWPIVGITERAQADLDRAINSNQPEHVGMIEMGGTWSVADDFMLSGTFWIENKYNHSEYVNFSETGYPFTLSAWYTPNACWSFVAGYANLTSWITQDVTLGREDGGGGELAAFTTPWSFTGKSDVINVAASYAASDRLRLSGQAEYVRAENFFLAPATPAGAVDYGDLPAYSDVVNDIYRLSAGFDYLVRPRVNAFFRYNFYDVVDDSSPWNSGVAHMFLGGVTGTF